MRKSLLAALAYFIFLTPVNAEITWSIDQYDPAAKTDPEAAADLVLPMPCGGAMAFQKVVVPVEPDNPLDDRLLRLGQSQAQTGYLDYFLPAFLRGSFVDEEAGDTYYYIARYELTHGQFAALTGACPKAKGKDRFAQGDMTWFQAVDLGRFYTEWLLSDAREEMPAVDETFGYLRLPTEEEWEYAVRGGAQVDAAIFPSRRFMGDAELREFARYQAAGGSARGKIGAIGTKKPNPLGLFDVYGNAEELMLEPFRLNAVGRRHGQVGGLVTRGGSYISTDDQIYSAQRSEYPMYQNSDGSAYSAGTFGIRFVLSSHVVTSGPKLDMIRETWTQLSGSDDTEAEIDPLSQLSEMIENEIDPRRKSALDTLQLDLRRAREVAQTAQQESAKSALLSGGMFVQALNDSSNRIRLLRRSIGKLTDLARVTQEGTDRQMIQDNVQLKVQTIVKERDAQKLILQTFRSVIDTMTADSTDEEREIAYDLLRRELTSGSQTATLSLVDRFWDDVKAYLEQPDMAPDALLQIAVSQ